MGYILSAIECQKVVRWFSSEMELAPDVIGFRRVLSASWIWVWRVDHGVEEVLARAVGFDETAGVVNGFFRYDDGKSEETRRLRIRCYGCFYVVSSEELLVLACEPGVGGACNGHELFDDLALTLVFRRFCHLVPPIYRAMYDGCGLGVRVVVAMAEDL